MRKAPKALVVGCVGLVGVVVVGRYVMPIVVGLTGSLYRSEHEFSESVKLHLRPDRVYGLLTDVGRLPEWFASCTEATLQRQGEDGSTLWKAEFADGEAAYVLVMPIDPTRYLLWRIRSRNRHVTAYWELELTPEAEGTRLALKATGVAHHWACRITSESIIDDETHLKQFLLALAAESRRSVKAHSTEESGSTPNNGMHADVLTHAGDA